MLCTRLIHAIHFSAIMFISYSLVKHQNNCLIIIVVEMILFWRILLIFANILPKTFHRFVNQFGNQLKLLFPSAVTSQNLMEYLSHLLKILRIVLWNHCDLNTCQSILKNEVNDCITIGFKNKWKFHEEKNLNF